MLWPARWSTWRASRRAACWPWPGWPCKESIRRRVVVVFAVFLVVLLFAGWFLDPASDRPGAALHRASCSPTTSYLVLLLALFLSALSLPADIKNRTLHTVVTKPVRPSEIVLGRILRLRGRSARCCWPAMGVISYVFVGPRPGAHARADRGRPAAREPSRPAAAAAALKQGVDQHGHEPSARGRRSMPSGDGRRRAEAGALARAAPCEGSGDKTRSTRSGRRKALLVGPRAGLRQAPLQGPRGQATPRRASTWATSGPIAASSRAARRAAAIWTFEGITGAVPERRSPTACPLEMTIEVFRTLQGRHREGRCSAASGVRNPRDRARRSRCEIFLAKKFVTDVQLIPARARNSAGRRQTESSTCSATWSRTTAGWRSGCSAWSAAQYFGMAQADLYFRAGDASFAAELRQGLPGHLAADGAGDRLRRDVQHVPQRAGGHDRHAGRAGRRAVQRVHDRAGQRQGASAAARSSRSSASSTQQNMITELEPGLRTNVAQMVDQVMQLDYVGACRRSCPTSAASISPTTWPTASTSAATCC